MKVCKKCAVAKPLDEFYKKPKMADGHLNSCIACVKAYEKNRRLKVADHLQAYEKARATLPHRVEARKQYAQTLTGKRAAQAANATYRKRYPLKTIAHGMVSYAIKHGTLQRAEFCENCNGAHKIEAHHDDYTKPLAVRWLCEACHKAWHRQHKPIYE